MYKLGLGGKNVVEKSGYMGHGIWLFVIFYLQDFKGATLIFGYSICPLPNFRIFYVLVSYYNRID